jgi:ABC-2 type transport system permease protein
MHAKNILRLGVKELWSLARDPVLILLIAYVFTVDIYSVSVGAPDTLNDATIAIVDEDQSPLSQRIVDGFQTPYFLPPKLVTREEMDARMDAGTDTFALDIPPRFQEDVLAGRAPVVQLNTDATRVGQAFNGSAYTETIVAGEVQTFLQRYRDEPKSAVDLEERVRYNPNMTRSWFASVGAVIDQITTLAVLLVGAALIRERERGTVEHLLVMPVTPFEIMSSKIWSMGIVVLIAATLSLKIVVQGVLAVPILGSVPLFLCGAVLHLFASASLGIFLATFARTMPQFGMLMLLVLLPLQMLSGGATPRESMPQVVQTIMLVSPTTHYVMLAKGILFRGAGMSAVWPQFLALAVIGTVLFNIALVRFRSTLGSMA